MISEDVQEPTNDETGKVESKTNDESSEQNEKDAQKQQDTPEQDLTERIVELEKEVASWKEKFAYQAAEMDNQAKRFEKEKQSIHKFGNEKILKNLVEVVDNFERTLNALQSDDDKKVKNIVSGIQMVHQQLLKTLEKSGLEKIRAQGEQFDPNVHEAMAQEVKQDKDHMEVIQVFENGYKLNGRLLRAAKVVVVNNE